jgi:2',3'-cyclic-nucleotide 2'-phosphodiesterase (5'-nucleotidase family)
MAFGVLFDFTGNANTTKVTKAKDMVREDWFQHAVNYEQPIDMFVVLGHNPAGRPGGVSTLPIIFEAIRALKPDTPITMLAGHAHARDTVIYDNKAVSIASGQ